MESANGGTLFLDEIGEMTLEMQAKLLRALQEERSSRWAPRSAGDHIRIVAATNRDLELGIKNGNLPPGFVFPAERGADQAAPVAGEKERHSLLATSFLAKVPFLIPFQVPVRCGHDAMLIARRSVEPTGLILSSAGAQHLACISSVTRRFRPERASAVGRFHQSCLACTAP